MSRDPYRREIYLGEYRVEWADQKISLDCSCGNGEIEVFSDTYTICPLCKRRYSILEIIKVEASLTEEDPGAGNMIDFMENYE